MMRTLTIISILFMINPTMAQNPKKADKVSINGKNMYYEIYGAGEPLLLLHAYSQSSKAWQSYVEDFSAQYEVYLVDLTGHGQSDPYTEKLSIAAVAQDLNALIDHLNLQKIKAIGFSYGGDVLYQLTLINPDLIDRMITIGSLGSWDVNDFPHWHTMFSYENVKEFDWIWDYHESEQHVRAIFEQYLNYTVRLSDDQLRQIKPDVLIILGDDDETMSIDEIVRSRKNLPNSDLWILPNVSHGAHEGDNKADFLIKAKAFLNKP